MYITYSLTCLLCDPLSSPVAGHRCLMHTSDYGVLCLAAAQRMYACVRGSVPAFLLGQPPPNSAVCYSCYSQISSSTQLFFLQVGMAVPLKAFSTFFRLTWRVQQEEGRNGSRLITLQTLARLKVVGPGATGGGEQQDEAQGKGETGRMDGDVKVHVVTFLHTLPKA